MNDYLMLLKWQLRHNFRFDKGSKKEKRNRALLLVLLSVCFLPMLIGILLIIYYLSPALMDEGLFVAFSSVIIGVSQITVFIFGIVIVMSNLYFAKDNEFLSSIPIKTHTVFLVKMSVIYLSEVILSIIIVVPALITAGISLYQSGYELSILYYLLTPITALLAPLVPLFVIILLSTPLMYLITFLKKRSTLAGIVGILLFVGIMALYLSASFAFQGGEASQNPNAETDVIEVFLEALTKPLEVLGKVFFINSWLINAMLLENAVVNLLINTAFIVAIISCAMLLANVFYKRGVTVDAESNSSTKKNNNNEEVKEKSSISALIFRDLKLILREPSLAFNCFMGILLTPIMVFIMTRSMSSIPAEEEVTPANLQVFLSVGMILFFAIMLMGSTNFFAIIGFSREGKHFYINKYLPVDYSTLIRSKMLLANIISVVGVTLICAIMLFTLEDMHFINVVFAFITILLNDIGLNYLGLYRDVKKVNLNWTVITQITKRSTNVVLVMLVGMASGMTLMIIAIVFGSLSFNETASWAILWATGIILGLIILLSSKTKLDNVYHEFIEKIEC